MNIKLWLFLQRKVKKIVQFFKNNKRKTSVSVGIIVVVTERLQKTICLALKQTFKTKFLKELTTASNWFKKKIKIAWNIYFQEFYITIF